MLLHTIILFISRASRDCSFNYTFLINALTNHSNFGLSIEAVVSFRTVVDKRYALQAEQVSIPVSEKVLWTLPIRRACSRFTHGSSYNKKQEYSSKDYFGVLINIVSILSMDLSKPCTQAITFRSWGTNLKLCRYLSACKHRRCIS